MFARSSRFWQVLGLAGWTDGQHALAVYDSVIAEFGAVQPCVNIRAAEATEAEVANFALYDQWINTVQEYLDSVQVFAALRNASEFNHLPAFERCAG